MFFVSVDFQSFVYGIICFVFCVEFGGFQFVICFSSCFVRVVKEIFDIVKFFDGCMNYEFVFDRVEFQNVFYCLQELFFFQI